MLLFGAFVILVASALALRTRGVAQMGAAVP
jgi:hypothetical protein